jgi:hypothetical protein
MFIKIEKSKTNEILLLHSHYAGLEYDLIILKEKLDILDKMAIKKNDYNAQTCITITPDGSQYIPLIIKDDNTKKALLESGELEGWNERTKYLDLRTLYKNIEE